MSTTDSKPIAWIYQNEYLVWKRGDNDGDWQPLLAQRQPLTIDEIEAILARWNYETHGDRTRYIVRETEAAHGIKDNT